MPGSGGQWWATGNSGQQGAGGGQRKGWRTAAGHEKHLARLALPEKGWQRVHDRDRKQCCKL